MAPGFDPGLVSVVVPTFNRAELLLEALQSVFEQTYRPIELLVIDDGSTDESRAVAESWSRQHAEDGRFKFRYLYQANSGASAARNLGLIESKGEYIQFLDSDDLLHPDKAKTHVHALESDRSADFVYSQTGIFVETPDWNMKNIFSGYSVPKDRLLSAFLQRTAWLSPSGLYTRRLCCLAGPWDESVPRCQDWEYNIRVILTRPHVLYIDRVLSLARFHTSGRISDRFRNAEGVKAVFDVNCKIEQRIRMSNEMTSEIEQAFSERYLHYAKEALLLGTKSLSAKILQHSAGLAVKPEAKVQTRIWRALIRLPAWIGTPLVRLLIVLLLIKHDLIGKLKKLRLK